LETAARENKKEKGKEEEEEAEAASSRDTELDLKAVALGWLGLLSLAKHAAAVEFGK
jgi:hypothetical protein